MRIRVTPAPLTPSPSGPLRGPATEDSRSQSDREGEGERKRRGFFPNIDFSPGKNTQRGAWTGDFRYEDGRILVKSTGTWMKNDWQLWCDIARWFTYYWFVRLYGVWAWATKNGPRICFTPHRPRPWYIIWAVSVWAGGHFVRKPEDAEAAFYFVDRTQAEPPAPKHAKHFNFAVGDVSKTHVARMNKAAFGYELEIDPETYAGPAVEKGEDNGLHDGHEVMCPTPRKPGQSYQRIVDTEDDDGMVTDLRTACVGRKPVVVFEKKKVATARFSIQSKYVRVRRPEEVFSAAEIAQVSRFCEAMQLDWGALDVLRERGTGRLYVVDVNKTDTGPAVILNWRDRTLATSLLAKALTAMVRG